MITADAAILISGISNTHDASRKTIAIEANHIEVKGGDLSVTEAGTEAGPKAVPDDPDDIVDPDGLVDPDVPDDLVDPDVPDDREGKKSGGRKTINPADQANVNYQAGTPKIFVCFLKLLIYLPFSISFKPLDFVVFRITLANDICIHPILKLIGYLWLFHKKAPSLLVSFTPFFQCFLPVTFLFVVIDRLQSPKFKPVRYLQRYAGSE